MAKINTTAELNRRYFATVINDNRVDLTDNMLDISTLKYRRYRGDMIETYKILHATRFLLYFASL